MKSPYRCPRSGRRLIEQDGFLISGDNKYPIAQGVPGFLQHEPVENDDDRALLERLNDIAMRDGWRAAIDEVHGDWPYVTDPKRHVYLNLLQILDDSTVLEIGSGLGQCTSMLAERARDVFALEVVPEQARFAMLRCQQQGHGNVRVASGGDDCRLPYADGVFDVVIANLVLEWCFSRNKIEDPVAVQQRMLGELFRVLKDNGTAFISTKNRYSLRLLIGKRDEHMWEIRWGSALPRWLQRIALRAKGRTEPRGVLHSHRQLDAMIRQAGFASSESYWAAPEMRFMKHCVPTDAKSIRAARREPDFEQGEGRAMRALMPIIPAALVKHVTPGLTFVAKKTGVVNEP